MQNCSELPSLIIFDWDGTLVSTLPLLYGAHNNVRKELGYPLWSMDEYKSYMHQSARALYPQLYGDDAERAYKILYQYVEENHLQDLKTIDGAQELLEFFQELGLPSILVSNKTDKYLQREVQALGWEDLFVGVIGAGVASCDKPGKEPVEEIMKLKQLPDNLLSNAIFVGDTETDIRCAENLNIPSILIGSPLDKGETAVYENLRIFMESFLADEEKIKRLP